MFSKRDILQKENNIIERMQKSNIWHAPLIHVPQQPKKIILIIKKQTYKKHDKCL